MRFEGYMLVVKNAQRAKVFYESVLGLHVSLDLGKHVIFQEGFFLLQEDDWCDFSEQSPSSMQYKHGTGELVFEVDDIAIFLKKLEKHNDIKILHPVKEHPWGRHAIRFYDLDGHIIEVGESMTVVVTRLLRQGMTIEEASLKSEFPIPFVQMCFDALLLDDAPIVISKP